MPEVLDDEGNPIEPEEPIEVTPPLETIKPEYWSIKLCPGGAGTASVSCVVAKSILWPGAVAVTAGRRFLNVYIGNAILYEAKVYSPPLPAAIQSEWIAVEESDALTEQSDITIDPTPPVPEGEAEEDA